MFSCACPIQGINGDKIMNEKTCAACDCELDAGAIKVNIGDRIVEVCCDECAHKLHEAGAVKKS